MDFLLVLIELLRLRRFLFYIFVIVQFYRSCCVISLQCEWKSSP